MIRRIDIISVFVQRRAPLITTFLAILYNKNIFDRYASKGLVLVNLSSVEESLSDQMKDISLLFITLILQVLQATARTTFYHINVLSDICKIAIKNQASLRLSCN